MRTNLRATNLIFADHLYGSMDTDNFCIAVILSHSTGVQSSGQNNIGAWRLAPLSLCRDALSRVHQIPSLNILHGAAGETKIIWITSNVEWPEVLKCWKSFLESNQKISISLALIRALKFRRFIGTQKSIALTIFIDLLLTPN